jgi:hypothetical protein
MIRFEHRQPVLEFENPLHTVILQISRKTSNFEVIGLFLILFCF